MNILFLVVLIGVTVTVVFVSQDINLRDVLSFARKCNPWYIVGAFGGLVGFILFEAISLHLIARKLGHKSKAVSSVAYSTSDLYYSAITPSASGGQPASAFYMMRDGMSGGTAGFTILLNIIAYTIATIVVGFFALVVKPHMFPQIGHWFAKTLIVFGFVIQFLLLAVLLLCLFRARVIKKIGNFGISVLAKMKIVKKPDKWRTRLDNMIEKYRSCRSVIKQHPMLFIAALLLNIAQRTSQTLIPVFVMLAAAPESDFLQLFCMQAYVLIGYNSIPLPGGTGAYEYLYPNVFGIGGYDMTFVLSSMMVSRAISYYLCMIVCGVYTLVYHAVTLKNIKNDPDGAAPSNPDEVDLVAALKQGVPDGENAITQEKSDEPKDGDLAENNGNGETTVENDADGVSDATDIKQTEENDGKEVTLTNSDDEDGENEVHK